MFTEAEVKSLFEKYQVDCDLSVHLVLCFTWYTSAESLPDTAGGVISFCLHRTYPHTALQGITLQNITDWYNGYLMFISSDQSECVYNPISVLKALETGRCERFWLATGQYYPIVLGLNICSRFSLYWQAPKNTSKNLFREPLTIFVGRYTH